MAAQQKNQLRIIGGECRRRIVHFPDGDGLRPTPDRVRETLFNWLGQDLTGKRCLDLFAGSGALGLEAASRGAARVVMVEKSRPAYTALVANRDLLKLNRTELVNADAAAWLARSGDVFDIAFVDPPYASGLLQPTLVALAPRLAPGARVYAEAADWTGLDLAGWDVLKEGRAGTVHYRLLAPA
ncbi:16S rRNA (guanine(966)-N(2))-methyltransferase RsmD [Jeongeupia sp. USM3]|uniref:16S rRNA (guanine(966)-N(2))-methyltransferase RsmD n=1 Tax=Jeongeupia sp. USM3 TaxID=1906741 RepID=UPI00089E0190|nr:16S rRNA (guanine(966)-N(2))-methyltransferase RsmD [Jeongeupia sp. USM3]AOY01038.1 16S rRNA (guanine(966)-N(2))-methyltransferase RsmD [Jeongeupia sp. USM3]